MTASLRVDCSVTAGAFTVVAQFDAGPGITVLFGPSGSGKSVTLAAIAGMLRPVAGTIELRGRTVADAAAGVHVATQQRRVGMVAQQSSLLPHRSPLDNVAMAVPRGQASGRVSRAARREVAQGWLARVEADHLADARTSTLSGGEQQRVALARAVAGQPEVLLLDEPFSALDHATRTRLRQLVRALVDDAALPAVLVTHDIEDVAALADRVVIYEYGRSLAQHDVASRDRLDVAQLLGLTVAPWRGDYAPSSEITGPSSADQRVGRVVR